MKYYIVFKGRKIGKPMTREEAILELFRLRSTFSDLSINVYDENDKLRGQFGGKKPPNES